jgi:hypothetical protein
LDVREFTNSLANGESAADYIENVLCAADNDLSAFAHKPILEALKLSPDGVSTCMFRGINNDRVNLVESKDLALAMKMRQAIIYHHPSGDCAKSTSHSTDRAMESYKEKSFVVKQHPIP